MYTVNETTTKNFGHRIIQVENYERYVGIGIVEFISKNLINQSDHTLEAGVTAFIEDARLLAKNMIEKLGKEIEPEIK